MKLYLEKLGFKMTVIMFYSLLLFLYGSHGFMSGSKSLDGPTNCQRHGEIHSFQMGIRSSISGFFKNLWRKRTDEELKSGIAKSLAWAYGDDSSAASPRTMVDVGCGVGGSSRHIVRKYNCTGVGVSLSPYQIQRATQFTQDAGLTDKLEYRVEDAMAMKASDNSYDLTWSMESGEHMPDKQKFMNELLRVTAPGGRIIVVTWCHRELKAGEAGLANKEKRLLDKINRAYYLPDWVPGSKYVELANKLGLEDVRTTDWSEYIAPFWPAVFRSALVPKNFFRMLRTGFVTLRGALATLWMLRGFQKGIVKFVLITGRKPASASLA